MQKQTILVLQGPKGTTAELSYLADMARTQDAHISVLHIGPTDPIPAYAYGGMPYGAVEIPHKWIEEREILSRELDECRQKTNAFFEKEGISGEAGIISTFPAGLDDIVAPRAMLCDVAIIHNDLREYDDAFRNLLYGVLFKSPTGIVLNPHKTAAPLQPAHVFLAWNTSKPAARAVREALPMLKAAKQVTIGTFDAVKKETAAGEEPGADLAKWLSHHGCAVTVRQYDSAGEELGAAIRDRASGVGADLIVMGAYGHTRVRQAVFGGTTRSMVEQTDVAVFLAH
ncbi:universal stress protein [Yoonia sp.]|uniref:universal stress protein n=1 Tax=Yoonia sp. TaxID=2212373 RepID=UPI001A0BED31|nr:universal stress protein [Yoonia sp.]MBE0414006.1 universal stress protein [Yoonia sp.]